MKKFYRVLAVLCAVLALICVPARPLWFGLAFFAALAVCSGAMLALYHVRETRRDAWGTAALWLTRIGNVVFVLWLVSVVILEGLIAAGAHSDAHAEDAEVVFVLGGGIRGEQPTRTLRERLAVGLAVMEENPDAELIVCGGQGADEEIAEATAMYNWMTEHGGDASRITRESQSRNTVENIENALAICEQNGWETDHIAVISSDFHVYRVRHIMASCGLEPCVIAAPSGGNLPMRILFWIREYFSIIKLMVSGGW